MFPDSSGKVNEEMPNADLAVRATSQADAKLGHCAFRLLVLPPNRYCKLLDAERIKPCRIFYRQQKLLLVKQGLF
jgi:hypothetical protein